MNQPAIAVSNLVKSYQPDRPNAVDGITFEVQSGQVFGLLGPNGAGKTTTIKMILGLVLPTSGSIQLADYDVLSYHHKALRYAGAILEGARNIYWRLSTRANLEYFGTLRGLRGETLSARIKEVLELVDLLDRADEETRYFSRGMQQKVALAVAMLHNPDVLLLDEPTLGLDVQASKTIERAIRKLVDEEGKAVLMTTHQMALAQRLCDRVFVINKGKQVVAGPTEEVVREFGGQHQTVEISLGTRISSDVFERLRDTFPSLSADEDEEATVLFWLNGTSQREILDLLNLLDEEGLPIRRVGRRESTLEEVFVQLTVEEEQPE
ncbi:MAG: ABC transporter ATP-binding protein [Anaerolineales bacterium]|jgi:ABC-2 type transport system ATP-binding protein